MKQIMLISALLGLMTAPVQAGCYADYKAKQDDPLKLHYGVAEVSACDRDVAAQELRARLARAGWVLLNVVSVFEDSGLAGKEQSAGQYFLRF